MSISRLITSLLVVAFAATALAEHGTPSDENLNKIPGFRHQVIRKSDAEVSSLIKKNTDALASEMKTCISETKNHTDRLKKCLQLVVTNTMGDTLTGLFGENIHDSDVPSCHPDFAYTRGRHRKSAKDFDAPAKTSEYREQIMNIIGKGLTDAEKNKLANLGYWLHRTADQIKFDKRLSPAQKKEHYEKRVRGIARIAGQLAMAKVKVKDPNERKLSEHELDMLQAYLENLWKDSAKGQNYFAKQIKPAQLVRELTSVGQNLVDGYRQQFGEATRKAGSILSDAKAEAQFNEVQKQQVDAFMKDWKTELENLAPEDQKAN